MDIPMQQPQPGLPQSDPYTVGFIPQQRNFDPMMDRHLDASAMLEKLKKMLMGMEYDEENDEWKPAKIVVGYDEQGNPMEVEEGPLMSPRDIRVTISYLQMFLNANTFLSQLSEERINDIMWDVSIKLGILFYNLRHKLSPETRDMIWGMIEYPILLGLSRANRKITLDAVSKIQQTHEYIQGVPRTQPEQSKEFKVLGW